MRSFAMSAGKQVNCKLAGTATEEFVNFLRFNYVLRFEPRSCHLVDLIVTLFDLGLVAPLF
jgi:hypothetical protein